MKTSQTNALLVFPCSLPEQTHQLQYGSTHLHAYLTETHMMTGAECKHHPSIYEMRCACLTSSTLAYPD